MAGESNLGAISENTEFGAKYIICSNLNFCCCVGCQCEVLTTQGLFKRSTLRKYLYANEHLIMLLVWSKVFVLFVGLFPSTGVLWVIGGRLNANCLHTNCLHINVLTLSRVGVACVTTLFLLYYGNDQTRDIGGIKFELCISETSPVYYLEVT